MRALYCMTKINIDEDEFLAAALAAAPKKYHSSIEMEQARAYLKGKDFISDNVIEVMVKH